MPFQVSSEKKKTKVYFLTCTPINPSHIVLSIKHLQVTQKMFRYKHTIKLVRHSGKNEEKKNGNFKIRKLLCIQIVK